MQHSSPQENSEPLPEPIERCYLLFWSGHGHRRRRAQTRPLTPDQIRQMLHEEKIYVGGEYLHPEFKPFLEADLNELNEAMQRTVLNDDQREFKRLLARTFELLWREGGGISDYGMIRLAGHKWRSWPLEEQQAVEECLLFLWGHAIQQQHLGSVYDLGRNADALGLALVPFFVSWLDSDASALVLYFGFEWESMRWMQASAERDWLCQPHVLERIQSDFFQAEDEQAAADISWLYEFVLWLCRK